jgi:AraC-like DNA-binding protein
MQQYTTIKGGPGFEIMKPLDELGRYVGYFWVYRRTRERINQLSTIKDDIYYSCAESFVKMVFAFVDGQNEVFFSGVQGQTQKPDQIPAWAFSEMIGFSFYPYAIPILFNLPSGELNDQMLELEILLGFESEMINEKLSGMDHTMDKVHFLLSHFRGKFIRHRLRDIPMVHAMQNIRMRNGNVNIADFSRDYSLSQKQFERRFREYAGFTPKLYARIVRFENAVEAYPKLDSLTDVAYELGYYDQSHFIHDFRKFSGFSPKKFFSLVQY